MIGYYKKKILVLKQMINDLQDDPKTLELLKEIQFYLIESIIFSERKINSYKKALIVLKQVLRKSRLSKKQARAVKIKQAFLKRRVRQVHWLLYVWRVFGDAVAFIYLDKWNVKPLIYNANNPFVKEAAGFLEGKIGLKEEVSLVMNALSHGVPAMLTDLTNSLRHGDVCLLGESIPSLIEVKSSENVNVRTNRQAAALRSIQQYLQTDEGENVRGFPRCKRLDMQIPEINYISTLDKLITQAMLEGFAVAYPEDGLTYVVSRSPDILESVIKEIPEPQLFLLNIAKNESSWMCYYPFSLAINKPENFYAFLSDEIGIMIILDIAVVRKLVLNRGYTFMLLENDPDFGWEFKIENGPGPNHIRISHHFINRIGFELLSLRWVLDNNESVFQWAKNNMLLAEEA